MTPHDQDMAKTPGDANQEGCADPNCYRTECLYLGTCWEDEFWAEGDGS